MRKEAEISKRAEIYLSSKPGVRPLRNNVGAYKIGKRYIHYGLKVGSSDWIIPYPILITQEMVGQYIARFSGVEIKDPEGRESPEQIEFREWINSIGGKVVVFSGDLTILDSLANI